LCHSAYVKTSSYIKKILITPELHRNHHSREKELQNSNYGAIFTFWDILFLTATQPKDIKEYGVFSHTESDPVTQEIDSIKNAFKK
jgi:sterol desaturase/sphingolipid hydroxylase (fatty acid hydroxylase superfamily)